jgi:hypothetical protein
VPVVSSNFQVKLVGSGGVLSPSPDGSLLLHAANVSARRAKNKNK